MRAPVYVFDPTHADALSRVRGIGRYIQVLRETVPADWIFTSKIDGIPTHAFFIQPFFTFFQKPLITRRITDRQIAVIHDLIPHKYPPHFPVGIRGSLYDMWSRHILRTQFDHVITDSNTSKQDIIALLKWPEAKISIVFPTLAKAFWNSADRSEAPGAYCIYVGDGTWNKNLVNIARAVQQANVTCMFVGKVFEVTDPQAYSDPWQAELRRFFELTRYDKRFIFTGYVQDAQLFRLYQQARVNLLVSRDEGFGFSYVEAGAFRCPSILADRPIFKEIAGDAALFCDSENPDSIAASIESVFLNHSLRNRLALAAYEQSQKYEHARFKETLVNTVYATGYGSHT